MSSFFTNWIRNPFRKSSEKAPCSRNGECLKYLQLIMDGEATPEQQKHFNQHIDECMPCFKRFDLEKTIRQVLQAKCGKKEVPAELIQSIKDKIKQSV